MAGNQADADLLSAGIDEANLGLNDQIPDPLRIHLIVYVVVDIVGVLRVGRRAVAREHDNWQLQADLQAQMVALDETDGPLQGGGDQVVDRHGRTDRRIGRRDPLQLQWLPRDGGDQPEGNVERRQHLGAVEGEIALRIGGWPEQLEIDRTESLSCACAGEAKLSKAVVSARPKMYLRKSMRFSVGYEAGGSCGQHNERSRGTGPYISAGGSLVKRRDSTVNATLAAQADLATAPTSSLTCREETSSHSRLVASTETPQDRSLLGAEGSRKEAR